MFNNEAPYKRFFSEKEYPIIQAIHDCDKDKILDMMHQGWNVNTMGKHGMSYLLYAVWEHNYDMTKFLLANQIWNMTSNSYQNCDLCHKILYVACFFL